MKYNISSVKLRFTLNNSKSFRQYQLSNYLTININSKLIIGYFKIIHFKIYKELWDEF